MTDADLTPLQPANTASPRDTLRSFLDGMTRISKESSSQQLTHAGVRGYLRAMSMLDYSTTPHSDTLATRTLLMVQLFEILNRLQLPADEAIPGPEAVKSEQISRWTLPGTSLSLTRVPSGPREGAFLFSADTVERLGGFYRQIQHLPVQPGRIANAMEMSQASEALSGFDSNIRFRLKPVDTSSPRSTLMGFMDSINRAHQLVMQAEAGLTANPPTLTRAQALHMEQQAEFLLGRAIRALDLSKTPKALRRGMGIEHALLIKEVLDRMLLPPVEVLPNADMVRLGAQGSTRFTEGPDGQLRWFYPNTEIEIIQKQQGPRKGEFLFSDRTVAAIDEMYQKVRDLPYRFPDEGLLSNEYLNPDTSEGFYDFYVATPGYLVPHAHRTSLWVMSLPPWFSTVYAGQTWWQWSLLVITLALLGILIWGLYQLSSRLGRRLQPPPQDWLKLVPPLLSAFLVSGQTWLIYSEINITGKLQLGLTTVLEAVVILLVALAIYLLFCALSATAVASPRVKEKSVDAKLIAVASRLVGLFLAAWYTVHSLRELGTDVLPLIAGLGVGGIAVALAAQRTLANFIGGLLLFANKPVNLGDFCRFGTQSGTVEEIGLQNTRIRTLENTLVNIPNADFSQLQVENVTSRQKRLFRATLQLRNETTAEQLRYLLAKLRELLIGHPEVLEDPARVRFIGYGPYSKDVEIFAYIDCRDQGIFLAIREDLLLRIDDLVREAGTWFAIPSQTNYLGRDPGLNPEKQSQAEHDVQRWRTTGKLPFPEHDEERVDMLRDRLDYPPRGSATHKPG